jgi:hypothetical protein
VADNHEIPVPRTMRPLRNGVIPLVHRGAEALEALLNGDTATAETQFGLLTPSETAHLGTAAGQLAAMARRRETPAVAEHATVYEVSRLPEGHDDYSMFVVTVEHRGMGRWAIVRHRRCLSRGGTWDAEVSEDRDEQDWLREHRYGLDEALDRARVIAPDIRTNGVSAREIAASLVDRTA